MRSASINAIGILNAAVQLTLRVASPWMGVLWLTTLPHRLMLLYFFNHVSVLLEPKYYAFYLWRMALLVFATFIVSLYGRAVYVRACHIDDTTERAAKFEPLKVPLGDFIPYVYTALINEFLFYLTLFTVVMWPLFIVYGGLAAATSYGLGGPKLVGAPMTALRGGSTFPSLMAITLVFTLGLIIAVINLYVLILVALTLCGPLLGPALPRWEYIFAPTLWNMFPKQDLTQLILVIGASMMIEPFWLAANVDMIKKARARKSGEDLRLWFQDIKNEATQ